LTIKDKSKGQAVSARAMKSYKEAYGTTPLLTSALEEVDKLHAPTFLPPVFIAQGHTSGLDALGKATLATPVTRTYFSILKSMYPLKVHHLCTIS
jgi:hypothetical protein